MKGQEVGSCQRRCPLCPCFQVGSGQGLNHLQLPAGAPRTAQRWSIFFWLLEKAAREPQEEAPAMLGETAGSGVLPASCAGTEWGSAPPGVRSPQGAASPRPLLSLLAVLAWCRAHACLDLFLRGAGCLLGDSLAAVPCWQRGAGGCVLTTHPSAFSRLGTHEVAALFPLCSKSLHFQPVLAVRAGGAVRGAGGLGAAGALGRMGAEGLYEMQGKAAGRPDLLLSTRLRHLQ